jgi:trehalose 6-phosphate synthase/phosphatase
MFDGNKTLEILNSEVNKGTAVNEIIGKDDFDFVFCAGDDVSDEYMFKNLPADSISVMVGVKNKNAKFFMENSQEMIGFFEEITRDYSNLT